MTEPKGKTIGSARAQFIASARIAVREFHQMRSPTECMRRVEQALKVLDKATEKKDDD